MQLKFLPSILLTGVMVLILGAVFSGALAQEDVIVRAYRTVNVRSGPSTTFPVIDQLTIDATAEVIGRSDSENNWLQIEFDGERGWVAYYTVAVEGDVTRLPVVDETPSIPLITIIDTPTLEIFAEEALETYVTSFRRVNVRSGPSTDYERVGNLTAGETAEVVGRTADNQWLQVEIDGTTGWVAFFVVSITGELDNVPVLVAPTITPSPTLFMTATPVPPTATMNTLFLTTRFNINLRAEPSFIADVVTIVPFNTTLEIEARSPESDWLRVSYDDETGWLLTSLVNIPSRRLIERLPVDEANDIEVTPTP